VEGCRPHSLGLVRVDEGLRSVVILALSLLGVDERWRWAYYWDEALLLVEAVAVDVGSVEASLGVVVERPDEKNAPNQVFLPLEKVDGSEQKLDASPLGCGLT
jgi:hypothetical protein